MDRTLLRWMAVALGTLLLASWLVPERWIRWLLIAPPPREQAALDLEPWAEERWIRILPVPAARARPDVVRERTPRPPLVPGLEQGEPDRQSEASALTTRDWTDEWTWDPTSAHRIARDLFDLGERARPDTVRARLSLLRHLALGSPELVQGAADTTQLAMAHRSFDQVDRWINQTYGPLWEAEGDERRLRDVIWRAFVEHLSEGGP